jgi:hypothetical protein
MKRTRLKTDIDYNFNELYIMVKTNVKISIDKISRDIFIRDIFMRDIIIKEIFIKLND